GELIPAVRNDSNAPLCGGPPPIVVAAHRRHRRNSSTKPRAGFARSMPVACAFDRMGDEKVSRSPRVKRSRRIGTFAAGLRCPMTTRVDTAATCPMRSAVYSAGYSAETSDGGHLSGAWSKRLSYAGALDANRLSSLRSRIHGYLVSRVSPGTRYQDRLRAMNQDDEFKRGAGPFGRGISVRRVQGR